LALQTKSFVGSQAVWGTPRNRHYCHPQATA
jgi:hypothetical protein